MSMIGIILAAIIVLLANPAVGQQLCSHSSTGYSDGCAGAPWPAGPIQYPALLNQYAHRPPWDVAGVDYYVGMPEGQVLKDWQTLISTTRIPGFDWDTRGYFRCNSGNIVIDGYDFTTGSVGWSIYAPSGGCAGLTITNSKMGCIPGAGIGQNAPAFGGFNIQTGNVAFVFKNNTVDYGNCQGSGGAGTSAFITIGELGCQGCTFNFEYNYMRDLYARVVSYGGSYKSFIYRYNMIENPATSEPGDPQQIHMNSLQGTYSGTVSPVFTFNTTFVSQSYAGGELPQFYYNGGGSISPTVSYNTFPFSGCNCISYKIHGNAAYNGPATTLFGIATISYNYMDTADSYGPFYPNSFNNWFAGGNVNMRTGAIIGIPGTKPLGSQPPPLIITNEHRGSNKSSK